MSLTTGLNIAKSALAFVSAETALLSRNIAGASDENYVRRELNPINLSGSGVQPSQVGRSSNEALLRQFIDSSSVSAKHEAVVAGLDWLHQTIADSELGYAPTEKLAALESALNLYAESPNDPTRANVVVARANDLALSLNASSRSVVEVRQKADTDMAASVSNINQLLADFETVNTAIVRANETRTDASEAYDQRDSILKQLGDEIGIRTIRRANDDIAIYTDSGVTLFEKHPRSVAFTPTNAFSPTSGGGAVYVDGVAVTGSNAALPIKNGRLAGLSELRDVTAVTYQTQLDEFARGVIEVFAETDPGSPATLPALTGLFSYSGSPNLPASGAHYLGIASEIRVNSAADPAQGGSASLVRDGGINGAGYVQNTTGAAGFNENILNKISELSTDRTFDSAAGTGTTDSLAGFGAGSVAWLEQTRSTVQQDADYRATLKAHTSVTLSNAVGVNVDEEMANLLELERSFEASARLISAIDQMFASLLQAAG